MFTPFCFAGLRDLVPAKHTVLSYGKPGGRRSDHDSKMGAALESAQPMRNMGSKYSIPCVKRLADALERLSVTLSIDP